MSEETNRQYSRQPDSRIHQGDIFREVECIEDAYLDNSRPGYLRVDSLFFPHIIVLSQDCDLWWDMKARGESSTKPDKQVESILVCPSYDKGLFVYGKHLEEVRKGTMRAWTIKKKSGLTTSWSTLLQNKNPRYHYLPGSKELGLNDMVIDFKHFYTIPRNRLYRIYEDCYVGTICELYRERLCQRFANFLSRIGLPDDQEEGA